ncbi:MAG: PF20097 family protein [Planctomycetaceae bacterium]
MKPDGQVACPICGEPAEAGCIYGPDGWSGLRWRPEEPSVWGNVATSTLGGIEIGENDGLFRGPFVRGIRCESCMRITLECRVGKDGPGVDLIAEASDLEQDGEWDQALKLYRKVLDEPRYRSHHEYARNGIKAIEEKIRMSKNA